MTDLITSAIALAATARERTECLASAYLAAVQRLIEAQASGDRAAIWRALHEATSAELDLTGNDDPVTGKLHDSTITCEVYEPGEPCARRSDCAFCRDECPLTLPPTGS